MVGLRRNDLHEIPRAKLIVQRLDFAIYFCADHAVSDGAVYGISKVNRSRAFRQAFDVALRGKYENLVCKKIHFECFHKFVGIFHFSLIVQQISYPFQLSVIVGGFSVLSAFFIFPVRRDSDFCRFMHLPRSDLRLEGLSVRADQRGMERLIHVRLWHGDIVLEASRHRRIHFMDDPKHRITFLHGIYDDADG